MHFMNPKRTDDVFVDSPDMAPMAPTDDELARLARSLREPEHLQRRAGDRPMGPAVPPVYTSFRAAAVGELRARSRRQTFGGRVARAFRVVLLLGASAVAAAFAWQSYGDEAEQMVAQWPSQIMPLISSMVSTPSSRSADLAAAGNAALPRSESPLQQAAPESVRLAAAAPSIESAPPSSSTTNDIASVRQEIEQLKGSIEELRAERQQMLRDETRPSETKAPEIKAPETRAAGVKASRPNMAPKASVRSAQAALAQARKPIPQQRQQTAKYPPLPQPVAPYVPRQVDALPRTMSAPVDSNAEIVPRPPMPVR